MQTFSKKSHQKDINFKIKIILFKSTLNQNKQQIIKVKKSKSKKFK